MNSIRVFFVGGLASYRALFHWMNPWIFVPMLIVLPVTQLLFFAYLGRASHTAGDTYFIVGNSLVAASLPGLFGMGHSISGERRTQTLAVLLASPANRLALFLGRALPAIANGFLVAAFCFGAGALLLRFNAGAMTLPGLALAMLVCSFSCTSLGLCVGALGLRGRNVSVLADMSFGLLLVIAGVDVPLARLPAWTRTLGAWLPLTHGTRAAREIVSGASIDRASHLLVLELIIGASYLAIGMALLRIFEYEGRRTASLEQF